MHPNVQALKTRSLFLELTSYTTVSSHEDSLITLLQSILPKTYLDSYKNLHCEIGNSDTLFVAHLDNYCESSKKVNHIICDDLISTDQTTILGADDKAGVTILVQMILNNVTGHYIFFREEELGCLGSLFYKKHYVEQLLTYSKCIAFDRRGFSDLVYCQNDINTASVDFANMLCNEFNDQNIKYVASDKGGVTDSNTFKYLIPECVNLAVGYFQNHTNFEKQNLKFLEKLTNAVVQIDWQNLPTFRQIPNLSQIYQTEIIQSLERRDIEVALIEKELGFSLY